MPARGIVMCPVHYAAFIVPFIDAVELNPVPDFEIRYARGEIDIVRDQQGQPGTEAQQKLLMARAFQIVREHAVHYRCTLNLQSTSPRVKCFLYHLVAGRNRRSGA